jgi:hypothetical protein
MIAVKVIFLLFPTVFPGADQEGAFSWTTILSIALMGLVGLFLSCRTGFPEIWDTKVSNRQRFLVPTLFGLVYGLITVLDDQSIADCSAGQTAAGATRRNRNTGIGGSRDD